MSAIRVAVADDSSFIRRAVARLLDEEPDLELVGAAARGEELLASLELWSPDAIVLDLSLPGMSGLEVLDAIMQRRPTPVIILSTHSRRGAPLTLEALNRGAVDFIDKQEHSLLDFERLRQALLTRLRGLRDGSWGPFEPAVSLRGPVPAPAASGLLGRAALAPEAIVFGASTGGPPAIERTLRGLGTGIDVPILVAQHMPPGFTGAFAERLDKALPLAVREAADGMLLEAGTVLLAPGGMHLRIVRDDCQGGLRIRLAREAGQSSVNALFRSAAEHLGAACIAVVLTGMGNDGAEGMLQLARAGALTIAQDEATSIVFGMPRAAIELGAAREILPLPAIAPRLREILNARHEPAEI
jgi:two-component system, chemotaxis family, protein-glutamate methylesterase/glutaminase